MDRRSFILSSLASVGAIATAKIAAAAELGTGASRASWETLHVERGLGGMLSFEGRATDWEMRPWTWRMFIADMYHGNPDAQLSEAGLQYAISYMGVDDEEPDWREKLEKELDEIHPKSGELAGQEDEFRFETSPTARAYYLMKEILEQLPDDNKRAIEEELGLWFQEDGLGVIAYVGDDKAEFLAEIIEALKLQIEVEEA
jgi:hypothetical protein